MFSRSLHRWGFDKIPDVPYNGSTQKKMLILRGRGGAGMVSGIRIAGSAEKLSVFVLFFDEILIERKNMLWERRKK